MIREKLDVNFYVVGSRVTDEIKALEQPGSKIIVKGFVSRRSCRSFTGAAGLSSFRSDMEQASKER